MSQEATREARALPNGTPPIDGRRGLVERVASSLAFAPAELVTEERPDGCVVLRSPQPLEPYDRHPGEWLRRWADRRPDTVFLAERGADDWRTVTYAEALAAAESIGQAVLDRTLGPDRPVMILSGNSVDHGLLMLGCFLAGVPIAPISPAYSTMSEDFGKLRQIFSVVRPGLVFVDFAAAFAPALESLDLADVEVVASNPLSDGAPSTPFAELLDTTPGDALGQAEKALTPDTVAKYLFTSGSTGVPKGVINTHRMLCSNQQMVEQCWPFVVDSPPVLVDWLPWNHTFGGNHNFNLVLKQGGTLHIDGGKPVPGLLEPTVENLREVSPTMYFNVPVGFAMLLPYLERDEVLRSTLFDRLQMFFYAGAALSQQLRDRLMAACPSGTGRSVVMASAWGSTETAPMATTVHFVTDRSDIIGLPAPGVDVKLVPSGSKREMRVRGPNVTPGYLARADLTRQAFDDEGFYKIGDAGRLADPSDPAKGLVFDGRVAEDFKLTTGTWVHVGSLRIRALGATSPALRDAVICGHDRDEVGMLAWINLAACNELCPDVDAQGDVGHLIRCPQVIEYIRAGLRLHNVENRNSSARIGRVLLLLDPPSIDANEVTDKGYINQRATLERRAEMVERLYADPPDEEVILV